jgi:hypothetical protein
MKRPSAAIRPEWLMSSEDAARATDALKKLRRYETQQWVGRSVAEPCAMPYRRVLVYRLSGNLHPLA